MNWKLICQAVFAIIWTVAFFSSLKDDIQGRKARAPLGYPGVVQTIIIVSFVTLVLWKAGTFSELLR